MILKDLNLTTQRVIISGEEVYTSPKTQATLLVNTHTPQKKKTQILLLSEVIIGDSVHCLENKNLREPSFKNGSDGPRFDSVIGNRHGTWIFVTYATGRAYPTYMIEYDPNS